MPTRPKLTLKKIDRYILSEVFGPFLGGIAFFAFIFLMFQALRLADEFIRRGASVWIVAKMTGLLILSVLPTALPVAFLLGVLIGFGRLSADSELVAMKANGISLKRLTLPVVALSTVALVFSLFLNLNWVPQGDREFKRTLIRMMNTGVAASIQEGTFTSGFFNLLVFADKLDPKTNRMQRVFIRDEREPKNPMTIVAHEGEILPVRDGSEMGSAIMFKLYEGSIHHNENATETYQKINFEEYRLYLKIEEGSDTTIVKPRMLPYTELKQSIERATPGSFDRNNLSAEVWRRIATAFSPLIFAFLGISYGTVRTRGARAGAALVTLITIAGYYTLQAVSLTIAQKGFLPAAIAMWIPNLVTAAVAWRSFRAASW